MEDKKVVLSVQDLNVKFTLRGQILHAIRGISLDVYQGESLAIVGESGSGKSVFVKCAMGLLDANGFIDGGSILYNGMDLTKFQTDKDWLKIRGKEIAMVFQDPMTSLNPLKTIGKQIQEAVELHQGLKGGDAYKAVLEVLSDVGIDAQILELIKAMQKKYDLTTIYITHDLGVVANVADRIAVMYAGDIVELGTCDEVFYDPRHPYTWALLSSLPQLGTKDEPLYSIQGTPPNLFHEVKGDAFAPRNPKALKIDFVERPPFFEVTPTHYARTWLMDPRAPKVEPPEHVRILREKGVNRVG